MLEQLLDGELSFNGALHKIPPRVSQNYMHRQNTSHLVFLNDTRRRMTTEFIILGVLSL